MSKYGTFTELDVGIDSGLRTVISWGPDNRGFCIWESQTIL